jgi:xyloglucan 6-xylosyltransferase
LSEGGEGDYAPDRCVKGMERAFNFADNQVLRLYGFEHRTLESAVASRVANRSVDPLEAKEAISYLRKPKDPPAPKKKSLRKNRKRRVKGGSVLARILVKLGWRD